MSTVISQIDARRARILPYLQTNNLKTLGETPFDFLVNGREHRLRDLLLPEEIRADSPIHTKGVWATFKRQSGFSTHWMWGLTRNNDWLIAQLLFFQNRSAGNAWCVRTLTEEHVELVDTNLLVSKLGLPSQTILDLLDSLMDQTAICSK